MERKGKLSLEHTLLGFTPLAQVPGTLAAHLPQRLGGRVNKNAWEGCRRLWQGGEEFPGETEAATPGGGPVGGGPEGRHAGDAGGTFPGGPWPLAWWGNTAHGPCSQRCPPVCLPSISPRGCRVARS